MVKVTRRVEVNDSKFAMWRSAIALAHCDGLCSNSEIDLIHDYWQCFDFSDEQQQQLDEDVVKGISIDEVYSQVTDKLDRAHLINFATVLFYIDGDYSDVEQVVYDKIYQAHMKTIDLKQALADARSAVDQYQEEELMKRAREKENASMLEKGLYYLTASYVDQEDVIW